MDFGLINKFLSDREKRVTYQERLMKEYGGTVFITVRANYPGIDKSNYITDDIVKVICDEISLYNAKDIIFSEKYKNMEGIIGHFVMEGDPLTIKKDMIDLESSHILGRCVDIDVYGIDKGRMYGLSRSDLNIGPRKCFLCDDMAKVCSRSQKHSIIEIKKYFEDKYKEYMDFKAKRKDTAYMLSNYALKAIISEVSTMPSFGLVSPASMGSHKDMDYYTFLDSSFAIAPFLREMAEKGYSYQCPEKIFSSIRPIGIEAERSMYCATEGVNTHKGMIFLIGVIIAAVSKSLYEDSSFETVKDVISDMCADILKDFDGVHEKEKLTHGEKLYVDCGFTGIRGEVKNGLSFLFDDIIPRYEASSLKGNSLYAETLLELMAVVDDSTIVYRQNMDVLAHVKKTSRELLESGGLKTAEGMERANEFEKYCIEENISPGGSADLLAAVIFLSDIKYMFK